MQPTTDRLARRRAVCPDSGFTILETVIALFIAMVIGFGAISLFLFSTTFNAGASDRARALALAQERMESYRATPFANLAITDSTAPVTRGSSEAGKSDLRTFMVNTKIENDADVPNNRQKIITVTVTPEVSGRWTSGAVMLKLVRASDAVGDN